MKKAEKKVKNIEKKIELHEKILHDSLDEQFFEKYWENRHKIYKMNFVRGAFFGFGTVVGGAILVFIFVQIMIHTVDIMPWMKESVQEIVDSIEKR